MRYFNVAGPCNPRDHYMIPAQERLHGVEQLVDMGQYFVIHAARQSGKTTYLMDLTRRLNAEEQYYALYCSLENVQGITNVKESIPAIVRCVKNALRFSKIPDGQKFAENANLDDFANVLQTELTLFCLTSEKPFIIFFDEADCLSEGTLISFLRQLRNGYNNRPDIPFVHSVALVGMRNIRDYKAHIRPDSDTLGSASPFNIVTKTMTLVNFTKEEIIGLYAQHTTETGQIFELEAIDLVWEKTQGQPWLVNAIAREVIVELLNSDYAKPITAALCLQAIQNIVLRRDVHIDSLLERLKEPRIRRVIEPMIAGDGIDIYSDDFSYTHDLGLVRIIENNKIIPANPIYGEVIIRTLNAKMQVEFAQSNTEYQMPKYFKDGKIDMNLLMSDFQKFWRKNGDIWLKKTDYIEVAPQLLMQAFLQRVINGGGNIDREMAAGNGRIDLCIHYKDVSYPIELKIRYDRETLGEALVQLSGYMDIVGCNEGWLCFFDRRKSISWGKKVYRKLHKTEDGKTINIIGL